MSRGSRRQYLRWLGMGSVAGLAGCSGLDSSTAETNEGTSAKRTQPTARDPESAQLPESEGCPDGTTTAPSPKDGPVVSIEGTTDHYYDGPLFLAHEHFYVPAPMQKLNWSMTAECLPWYLDFMERNGVSTAITFNGSHQLPLIRSHPERFAPFVSDMTTRTLVSDLTVSDWPQLTESLLSANSEWAGVGELALYRINEDGKSDDAMRRPEEPLPADDPSLSEVYRTAAEHDATVMIHPYAPPQLDESHRKDPRESPEVQALERAFEQHRETTFLVHGLKPVGEWISTLLDDHPNWYYDVSGAMTPHAWGSEPGVAPVEYDEHMTPEHIVTHAQNAFETWKPIFQNAPDRVVVGFDLGRPWHLDARVLDSWAQTFRGVLGRLSQETAANIGHKNAERMLVSSSDG